MRRRSLFALLALGVVAPAASVACGHPTDGTCEEANDCSGDDDAGADAFDESGDSTAPEGSPGNVDGGESGVPETDAPIPDSAFDSPSTDGSPPDAAFADAGAPCTKDTDCASTDCLCGLSSGDCADAGGGVCGHGMAAFNASTSGASVSFTVPGGCTSIFAEVWGAGGGPVSSSTIAPDLVRPRVALGNGGPGAFASGTFTGISGNSAMIWVGQGAGTPSGGTGFASGGNGAAGAMNGGGGGGSSAVLYGGAALGAGGGGGGGQATPGWSGADPIHSGGASDRPGTNATVANGGGGGGGFLVGGTGASTSGQLGGFGGQSGGSGPMTGITVDAGVGTSPANVGSTDYRTLCQGPDGGAGQGGSAAGTGTAGTDGCVVVRCN